jgi:hypothetical protein
MMLSMEVILRMEMIHALLSKVRDGMDSSNGMIQRFQRSSLPALAPFQHVVLSSNPLGIQKGVWEYGDNY